MTKITLDSELSQKLHQLAKTAELCDPSGKVLGKFVPVFDSSEWELIGPEITDEELDRREQEGGYISHEEMMAELKRLRNS
jgi:hypothetical protein